MKTHFELYERAVSLIHDTILMEAMKTMVTSFKRSCAGTAALSLLTLQQATVDPCLRRSLLDTHGQVYVCFIDYNKAFDCVDHNKLWNILKEMGTPDHLTWLLRNLYAGQETIVRSRHGTKDWFQIRKGVHQGCILSPCLFNLYAEYIM